MMLTCALCSKELTSHDCCISVNKYTWKENEEYWAGIHAQYGIHIVPQGEPIYSIAKELG